MKRTITLYKHVLTVTVVSTECSPDRIERLIEAAGRSDTEPSLSIHAMTDATNRRDAPCVRRLERPRRESFDTDAEYFCACDEWRDTIPNAATWDDDTKGENR